MGWQNLLGDWLKLNSDGAVHVISKSTKFGRVIRDGIWKLPKDFSCKIGVCSIIEIEL